MGVKSAYLSVFLYPVQHFIIKKRLPESCHYSKTQNTPPALRRGVFERDSRSWEVVI